MAKFRVIVITGQPATGKSTLVRKAFDPQKMPKQFSFAKLKGHTNEHVFVGGIYNGELFEGTDKLSMAVQPDAIAFLQAQAENEGTLVMEGDRVANAKFLAAVGALGLPCHLIVLEAEESTLHTRHAQRGDSQTERWLASRRTKVKNLLEAAHAMPHVNLHVWRNETPEQAESHVIALQALTQPSA